QTPSHQQSTSNPMMPQMSTGDLLQDELLQICRDTGVEHLAKDCGFIGQNGEITVLKDYLQMSMSRCVFCWTTCKHRTYFTGPLRLPSSYISPHHSIELQPQPTASPSSTHNRENPSFMDASIVVELDSPTPAHVLRFVLVL